MNVSKDLGYWIREFLTGTRHITSYSIHVPGVGNVEKNIDD